MTARKILIVEDDECLRLTLADALENEGYDATFACGGDDARTELGRASFDLILTDLYMPKGGGADLVRYARSRPELRSVPIVVMSAGRPEIDTLENIEEFLRKPMELDDLLDSLKRCDGERRDLPDHSDSFDRAPPLGMSASIVTIARSSGITMVRR